jgi:Flp pilus assembly protein TadG
MITMNLLRDPAQFARGATGRLVHDSRGNFGLLTALAMATVLTIVGAGIDYTRASSQQQHMQTALDAAVLAAMRKSDEAQQRTEVEHIFLANFDDRSIDFTNDLHLTKNPDGSLTADLQARSSTVFMSLLGIDSVPVKVRSSAISIAETASGPCIIALGNSGQDVLVNSGADVRSTACAFDVHSTRSPAFMMNSGSTLQFTEFCVKGTNYTWNGGTLNNLKTGCAVHADPYAGVLPEPTVPSTCTTSGYPNGTVFNLNPGVHCATGFNGSPTITFKPGLHIIKGRMIINSGATVIAEGVTFYFPDVNSEIRANGALKFTATAPTTGTYKGILMFEKTSNAANNANKQQYVFNGSKGETLEGVIYLPNRNVTYNSTTNVTAKISMVVNQMIINSAKWRVEPYTGYASSSAPAGVRLTQ